MYVMKCPYCIVLLTILCALGQLYSNPIDIATQESREIVGTLSDVQIIAQLLMVGWQGIEASENLESILRNTSIGGVKIFGWNGTNIELLKQSIRSMQDIALTTIPDLPLLVATDQEGGLVRHIKDSTAITSGNLAIGASNLVNDAYLTGFYINNELAEIGVTMNFAPTVDVLIDRENAIIGTRAFSSDPRMVAILGTAYTQGSLDAKIIPTAKHFPGHGNTRIDSHGQLPIIQDDYDTLWERDLYPYRVLIPSGLPAILTGHLSFPKLTDGEIPSTFSSEIVQGILRDKLQFDGLVITDDIYMEGALSYAREKDWSIARLVLEAILVGNDMVMLSRTPTPSGAIFTTLLNAYRTDEYAKKRMIEAATRVIALKLFHSSLKTTTPLPKADVSTSRNFFLQNALRSVTVLQQSNAPPVRNNSSTLVIGNDYDFIRAAGSKLPEARRIQYQSSESPQEIVSRIRNSITPESTLVFLAINGVSYEILKLLEPFREQLHVVVALNPYPISKIPWVKNAIAVYGWNFENYLGGFSVLTGEIEAFGTLPIR